MAGAVSMKSGTPTARSIGKSISVPSTLTALSSSWPPRFFMRWRISTIWFMAIQDVSNNGYYHNLKFKATAEAYGLHIEKHAKYGRTVTTLVPEAEVWIRETLGEDKINACRLPVEGTTKGESKKSINRSIKYVCPCCGIIIQATREVNVICRDCGEAFEREYRKKREPQRFLLNCSF